MAVRRADDVGVTRTGWEMTDGTGLFPGAAKGNCEGCFSHHRNTTQQRNSGKAAKYQVFEPGGAIQKEVVEIEVNWGPGR